MKNEYQKTKTKKTFRKCVEKAKNRMKIKKNILKKREKIVEKNFKSLDFNLYF